MDAGFFFSVMPLVVVPLLLLNFAWYVAVIVLLIKIWQKVRHMPA